MVTEKGFAHFNYNLDVTHERCRIADIKYKIRNVYRTAGKVEIIGEPILIDTSGSVNPPVGNKGDILRS